MTDDITREALKRMWVKQLLSWCKTGLLGNKKYTQKEMQNLIVTDGKAKEVVTEYAQILNIFGAAKDREDIETQLRDLIQ